MEARLSFTYLRAVELDPLNMNGLDNLAGEYLDTKQFEKTIEQSKKNLEIDPSFARAHFTLSMAYFTRSNPSQASVPARSNLASDFSFCFQCKVGSS